MVFSASGTFADGTSLSGSVTIDTATGVATALDLFVSTTPVIEFNLPPNLTQFTGSGRAEVKSGSKAQTPPRTSI
jgi:hypothetical protein